MTSYILTGSLFLLATFLVLAPLIFHEMGHWAALRRFGVPVSEYWVGLGPVLLRGGPVRIAMLPIGGAIVPEPHAYSALAPLRKMAVALAGPFASLVYGGVIWCAALLNQHSAAGEVLFTIANLNFVLTAVNLLPVPPLDGFQAWASWREYRSTPLSSPALAVAARVGNGLVYGVGFLVLGLAFFR